jgi:predicted Zn finger-like uncharacterized protein
MKFVCDRCQTKYSIADEKVRGRILKVRCKNCANVVVVKESGSPAGASANAESERTVISGRPPSGVFAAPPSAVPATRPSPFAAPPTPPPPPPSADDGVQWFLAIDGVQKGPFTRKILIDKVMAFPPDADVHVWNENLDGWKPPKQVPLIARELQARQRPLAPRMPPPPPRPHAVPPPPSHAAMKPPSGLPGPSGSLDLPGSGGVRQAAAASRSGAASGLDLVVSVETPAPLPSLSGSGAHKAKNGVDGHNGQAGAAAGAVDSAAPMARSSANGDSDAMNALNLGSVWGRPAAAAAGAAAAWQPSAPVVVGVPGRHRNLKLVAAFIGIVGVCVVVLFNFVHLKKPPALAPPASSKAAGPDDGFAAMADKVAKENAGKGTADDTAANEKTPTSPPALAPPTVARFEPPSRGSKKSVRGRGGRNGAGSSGPETTPPPVVPLTAEQQAAAARFGDTSHRTVQVRSAVSSGPRLAPDQGEISRVVNNNKGSIKVCYQRALLRDSTLTHGKISVRVTVGLSGRVKEVGVDGPSAFRVVTPCIKDVLSRWVFPPSSEEYGTEFSYLFQGNE